VERFELNGVALVCPEGQLTDKIRGKLASGEYEGESMKAPRRVPL